MEHILVSRISKHLDRYGILNDSQHGFMRARSCETQLIAFIDDLAKEMQGGGQTDVIVMDFSKAFDKQGQRYTGNTQTHTFHISVQTSWQGPGTC